MAKIGQLSILCTESLGSGRFGSVFPGKITNVVEEVAIKRMKKDEIEIDSSLYTKANGQPNVIGYYGTHDDSNKFMYLAIEYCMGTLEDLVCGGYGDDFAMTDESHLPVLHQITSGLNQLHSLGIVHGNLKPSNILVSFPKGDGTEPTMKLADFGIRHAVRDKATGLTHFRLVTTEGWMCLFDTHIGPSFDLLSLGCVFGFIALNGLHPFGTDPICRIRNKQPMALILGRIASSLLNDSFLDLLDRILDFNSKKRPSALYVLNHQVFNQQPAIIFSPEQQENGKEQYVVKDPFIPLPSTSLSPSVVADALNSARKTREKQLKVNDATELPDYSGNATVCDVLSFSPPRSPPQKKKKKSSQSLKQGSSIQAKEDQRSPDAEFGKKLGSDDTNTPSKNEATAGSDVLGSHQPSVPSSSSPSPINSIGKRKKKLKCDFCEFCCDFKSKMSRHINSHTGAKPFECEQCSKKLSRLDGLINHRKTHSPPTFKCDFCPKMFTFKWNRDDHMNTHTGAKPFKCTICKKGFSSTSGLSYHRKTHCEPKLLSQDVLPF